MNEKEIVKYASKSIDVYSMWKDDDNTLIINTTLMGYEQVVKDLKQISPGITILNYMDYIGDPQIQIYGEGKEYYNQRVKSDRQTIQKKKHKDKVSHQKHINTHIEPQVQLRNDNHESQYIQQTQYSKPKNKHRVFRRIRGTFIVLSIITAIVAICAIFVGVIGLSEYELYGVYENRVVYTAYENETIEYSKSELEKRFNIKIEDRVYLGYNINQELKDISTTYKDIDKYYYVHGYVQDNTIDVTQPTLYPLEEKTDDKYIYAYLTDEYELETMSVDFYEGFDNVVKTILVISLFSFVPFIFLIIIMSMIIKHVERR